MLSDGELKPGLYITVFSFKDGRLYVSDNEIVQQDKYRTSDADTITTDMSAHMPMSQVQSCLNRGEVYIITAVMLPFIRVISVSSPDRGWNAVLDTRSFQLMECSLDYIRNSIHPNFHRYYADFVALGEQPKMALAKLQGDIIAANGGV